MLRVEIEKIKKNRDEQVRLRTCACKFCGQMANLELPLQWSDSFCDEAATELCECYEAQMYTKKKARKERAFMALEEQFANSEVKELLENVVDYIVEEKIVSATVDIGNGLKAKIALTSKGNVKVDR